MKEGKDLNLTDLAKHIQLINQPNLQAIPVTHVTTDSREVVPGTLFVAIKGYTVDGHDYAELAVSKGAVAVVSERPLSLSVPNLIVRDSTRSVGLLASAFYQYPSEQMRLFGITGTNGKTTTTTILRDVLTELGHSTGLIGTVEVRINDTIVPSKNTTPQSSELQQLLARMHAEGVTDVMMEVSSHGLELGRVIGTDFDIVGFTNLTHDHLDFHGTFENYARAKGLLFAQLGQMASRHKVAVLNADDPYSKLYETMTGARVITYAIDAMADVTASDIVQTLSETSFCLNYQGERHPLTVQFIGRFNVYNILLATGCLLAAGYRLPEIVQALEAIHPAKGRMQRLDVPGYNVYADYAHTPDGIEQCLKSLVGVPKEKIVFLIGTGGNRDVTKRPTMGEMASKYAGTVVITTDDPRFEAYDSITSGIAAGMTHDNFVEIGDREEAVRYAAKLAESDNIVVLAGKGHEKYQIIGNEKIPLDEEAIVRATILKTEES
ncbi:UDP-N-acetylmuramoyl-L-alanyl-D-glutamate--2,6-diaminopimelate ligase [Exiguobacterium sp. IPCH1]|uniref:UDP-N-acetylmuramoyl-L-alanyl-D-glutamate--2, 6-diaminopimelate ligase n=1 Tax=Exiguobacterium sp. IPBC4 TaxID=2510946 RepID=UPI000ACF0775|nr:UDP-N-acetylmuramoyl-L-alanyl-D-glutamate--2,6-diaminopimelate ligase [Exiguobacterium sp. IPBC4]TCI73943.1 UDP-N-acetylmuramoyl-L-alanyl-D-glutamate--2,6-diaminopimelate ligase [Exiguobacterium sp. IPCI3]TCI83102.1 UDP-N-acetylmuramoyl-L-alanyl-D-glutamate--2,6-diaminopimelate ligase [Exiguobacterium sp. IPCH1]TCI84156.1 UDP-N-acetylmuramoyl-L-alanyl-D-glutamate--2,6-diaminopimelate ligase [Exiguobacterium sp. IPBC4]